MMTTTLAIPDKETAIIRYYNATNNVAVDSISEIPFEFLAVISEIPYKELCRPFIIADLRDGLTQRQIARKYRLPHHIIRRIGLQNGQCK